MSPYRRYPPKVNWGCLGVLFAIVLFWFVVYLLIVELG